MTVLAWDGKALAADRLACCGMQKATVTKIARAGDELIGICGSLSTGNELREWYLNGANPDYFPSAGLEDEDSELIVVKTDGTVWVYNGSATPFQIEDPVCAFGAGAQAAWGALLCGVSAERAVEIASQINISCGNGLDVLVLHEGAQVH